jgi:hypothetical protein
MRRVVLLTYLGVALACFAGCHKWHHKCFHRACYNACEPCGCAESISGPIDGVAVPTSQIIPGPPSKVIPLSPSAGIPGPPGSVGSTPRG